MTEQVPQPAGAIPISSPAPSPEGSSFSHAPPTWTEFQDFTGNMLQLQNQMI